MQPPETMTELRATDLNAGDVLTLGNEHVEVETVVINDGADRTYIEYSHRNTGCTVCNDDIGGPTHHRVHNHSIREWSESGYLKRIKEVSDA